MQREEKSICRGVCKHSQHVGEKMIWSAVWSSFFGKCVCVDGDCVRVTAQTFTGNLLFFLILVKTFTGGVGVFSPPFCLLQQIFVSEHTEPLDFAPLMLMAYNTSRGTHLLLSASVATWENGDFNPCYEMYGWEWNGLAVALNKGAVTIVDSLISLLNMYYVICIPCTSSFLPTVFIFNAAVSQPHRETFKAYLDWYRKSVMPLSLSREPLWWQRDFPGPVYPPGLQCSLPH